MKQIRGFAELWFVLAAVLIAAAQGETPRTIRGSVTDNSGSVVTTASVAAIPSDEQGSAGDFGWVHVDEEGRFRLTLTSGRYVIRAKAEADGYTDPSFLLSSDSSVRFPEITVAQADISNIHVVLGMKGGMLAGNLQDEATQQPVPKGKVTIRDARQRDAFVEVSADQNGHFQFTVPNKAIQLIATAPGYRTTYYENGSEIVLSGGEHRSVSIRLSRQN